LGYRSSSDTPIRRPVCFPQLPLCCAVLPCVSRDMYRVTIVGFHFKTKKPHDDIRNKDFTFSVTDKDKKQIFTRTWKRTVENADVSLEDAPFETGNSPLKLHYKYKGSEQHVVGKPLDLEEYKGKCNTEVIVDHDNYKIVLSVTDQEEEDRLKAEEEERERLAAEEEARKPPMVKFLESCGIPEGDIEPYVAGMKADGLDAVEDLMALTLTEDDMPGCIKKFHKLKILNGIEAWKSKS